MKPTNSRLKQTLKPKIDLPKEERDLSQIGEHLTQIHGESREDYIRTTIDLPRSIHRKIKLYCVGQNMNMKDYITDILVQSAENIKA